MDVLFGSGSKWESLSESSEDQEELEFLYSGQAMSLLCNLDETIGKIDDFLSFERSFFHGDIVCLASEPSGQMGRIVNVDMLVNLEAANGKVIRDVSSEQILKIRSLVVADYVVHEHWLGRVDKVVDSVTVVFDDGTKCDNIIASDQEIKLVPIPSNIVDDPQYPFYPGQRVLVKVVPAISTRQATRSWLCGSSWKASHKQGTICAVKAGMVYIHWIGSAVNLPSPPPSKLQDAKDVTPLSCILPHSNWQLGDWCMLPPTSNNEIFSHKPCGEDSSLNIGEIFVVAKTKTRVDVVWQDGTQSLGLDSKSLLPINIIDAHEFWPHQFVLEKEGGCCEDPLQVPPLRRKWGVVQSVDAKEKTVNVKWWENNVNLEQETVSAYELIEHPDYSFCLGDLVFRLLHDEFGSQTESGELLQADLEGDNFYLSCIGNVVGFKDGAVEVKWATSLTTMVAPYEIVRFDKYEGSPLDFDENVEPIAEQMVDQDLECSNEKGKGMLHYCSTNQGHQKYSWKSISYYSLPWSVIGFFTDFAVNLFRSSGSTPELRSSNESCQVSGNENKSEDFHENGSAVTCDQYSAIMEMQPPLLENDELLQKSEKASLDAEEQEIDNVDSEPFSLNRNNRQHLKQFEMVTNCSDHFFLDRVGKEVASSPQVKRSWLKKVEREWCILDKNLPETIFARAYEERMDLLRAAIIGAPGTPYHDGIFFFDIFLPPDYPNDPPRVHYHSGGLRLNPNLYESGKVCLSLLNTWTGADSEVWNPQSSTILQVLVSLQALVLNDKPYFNEAGYDTHMGKTEGEKNSVSYNENAFLLTCQSMIYLLRKPPKHFEEMVMEHFRARCPNILSACKEYMNGGALVGFASHENDKKCSSSTGFKIMLSKLFDKLIEAFNHKGIDCGEFVKESP